MTQLINSNMGNRDKCCRKRIRGMGMGNACGRMCCAFELSGQGMSYGEAGV